LVNYKIIHSKKLFLYKFKFIEKVIKKTMKNKLEGSDGIETLNKMGFMA
jgi:hypothetical protein